MHTIKRIVISGGPATGKTSIIHSLKAHGYVCFPEISREIIQSELQKNSAILPWDDLHAFSQKVIAGRIQQFKEASTLAFYDRSIIDSLAYMKKDDLPIPQEWEGFTKVHRYHRTVFIAPPWKSIFENDHERRESWTQLLALHEHLVSAYEAYGYQVAIIPTGMVEDRMKFILASL